MKTVDISGKKYGRLTVVEFEQIRNRHYYWRCLCECGKETVVDAGKLKNGHTQSCGCLLNEDRKTRFLKHGHTKGKIASPEYSIWSSMISRCTVKTNKSYPRYGGRGISVCERWRTFQNFLADMGARKNGQSLDRINNDGDYEPSNVRWSTPSEQARNKRNSLMFAYEGKSLPLATICEIVGVSYHTVWQRINRLGWSFKKSIEKG